MSTTVKILGFVGSKETKESSKIIFQVIKENKEIVRVIGLTLDEFKQNLEKNIQKIEDSGFQIENLITNKRWSSSSEETLYSPVDESIIKTLKSFFEKVSA
jgi:hypothetical protein